MEVGFGFIFIRNITYLRIFRNIRNTECGPSFVLMFGYSVGGGGLRISKGQDGSHSSPVGPPGYGSQIRNKPQ